MKHRIALVIRKKGTGTGDLVHIFQNILKGSYGCSIFIFLFGAYDEFAAFIGAANNDQRSGCYGMVAGKLLDLFMNNILVFKAKYKNSTGFAL
jgi:hypothetical protein